MGFACGARTRDRGDTCVQGRGQQTGSVASPVPSHKLRLCFHGKWCGRPQGSRTNSPCLADGAGSGPDSAQLCPRGWQGRGPAGPRTPCQLPGSPGWASRGSLLGGKEGSPGTSVTPPPGSHAAFTSPVTTRGTALPSWQPPSAGSSRRQSSTFGAHELRGPWPGTAWREGGTEADPRGEGAAPHRRGAGAGPRSRGLRRRPKGPPRAQCTHTAHAGGRRARPPPRSPSAPAAPDSRRTRPGWRQQGAQPPPAGSGGRGRRLRGVSAGPHGGT